MNERTIFLAALDIAEPGKRSAYLEEACAGNPTLRQHIEELLQSHAQVSGFLAKPALEQIDEATGCTEDVNTTPKEPVNLEATQAESGVAGTEDLSFLAPSSRPGSIGRLGHYDVLEVIGKGGFGIVLKGFDNRLRRVVAIKVLSPAFAANGSARKRFIREARAAAAVKNEHVVGIYDVQEEAQPPYLVMECIDGSSLQDKLDMHGALGVKQILRIGMQIAQGLAVAHQQGLVHRDIKPANILLENGVERVKITDFGLARAVDDASVTQSGTVAGTPMYMSPEQAEGLPVDHRSDLFSLGSVLYAMCTGHPPFRASGTHAVLKRVIDASPRPIREINGEIPDWLCDIVAKLHAKTPAERFASAKEVAELLEQHLAHLQQPNQAPRPAPVARAPVPEPTKEALPVALRHLRLPANGLLITGILYLATVPFLFVIHFLPRGLAAEDMPFLLRTLGVIPIVVGAVLILAASKMKRGEWYTFCLAAVLLPLALLGEKLYDLTQERFTMALGDWTVLPFGLWALVVLTRRDVRQAFGTPLARHAARRFAVALSLLLLGLGIASYWFSPWLVGVVTNAAILKVETVPDREVQYLNDVKVAIWQHGQKVTTIDRNSFDYLRAGVYQLSPEGCFGGVLGDMVVSTEETDSVQRSATGPLGEPVTLTLKPGQRQTVRISIRRKPPPPDQVALQGRWLILSQEMGDSPVPGNMLNSWIEFDQDHIRVKVPSGAVTEQRFLLNADAKPRQIDLFGVGKSEQEGTGIYALDGDSLKLCIGETKNARPQWFTTQPGSTAVLTRCRREKSDSDGWVSLFNGKDLTGWKTLPEQPGDWRVIDNILVGSKGPGHLFSVRDDFQNFWLRAEVAINKGADADVYFRSKMQPPSPPGQPKSPSGYVVDIGEGQDCYAGPISFRNPQSGVWTTFGANSKVKPDEWFTLDIIADGDHLTTKINGEKVVRVIEGFNAYKKGHIALQMWGPDTVVNFHKIEIKELPHVPLLPETPDQVLPALAGAWKGEFTQKIYGGKAAEKKFNAVAMNDWIVGKKWLRQRVHMETGGFLSLVSFEPNTNSFRDWYFDASGLIFGPSAGRWDPATHTMTWTNSPENGMVLVTTWRFVDADTVTWNIVLRDKEGRNLFEMGSEMKRTTENIVIDETTAAGPLPPEMAVLHRLVGDWQFTGVIKNAENPAGVTASWQSSTRKILGGRVIVTEVAGHPHVSDSYSLSTFDAYGKAYGRWWFRADGSYQEYGGGWDEKTQTMKWNWAGKDGSQSTNTWHLGDPNRRDWQIVTKDAVGKTTLEVQATSIRQSERAEPVKIKAFDPMKDKPATEAGVTPDQGGWRVEATKKQDVLLFVVPGQGIKRDGRLVLRGLSRATPAEDGKVDITLLWRRENGYFGGTHLVPLVTKNDWQPWTNALAPNADPSTIEIGVRFAGPGKVWLKDLELVQEPR
jgi:uncharacterized protein (TIGR03067 family)